MATLLSDDEVFNAPASLLSDDEVFGKPKVKEGAFARAGRIAADPEGGVLPAAGSLIAAALPEGGGKRGVSGVGKDTTIDLTAGVVGLGESVIGLGNLVTFGQLGKGMEALGYDPKSTSEFLTGLYTEDRKAAEQNVTEAEGFLGTLGALAVNPSALFGRVVQSIPSTVAGGAAAGALARRLLPGATAAADKAGLVGDEAVQFIANYVGRRAALAAGGAEGAMAAGSIAEQGRQAGQGFTDYALPAVGGGLVTGLIGAGSGAVARKLGVGDIETDIAMRGAGQPVTQAASGAVGRVLKEAGKEGFLEEAPQSFNEAVAGNLAQGKPWDENVGKQTAEGLAAGAAMGGANAGFRGSPEEALKAIETAPDVDSAIDAANEAANAPTALEIANQELEAATPGYLNTGGPIPSGGELLPEAGSVASAQQSTGQSVASAQQPLTGEAQRAALDRSSELLGQANTAGTTFEQEQALAQSQVAAERAVGAPKRTRAQEYADLTPMEPLAAKQRLVVLRSQTDRPTDLVIAKHPSVPGKLAIRQIPPVVVAEKQQSVGPSVASTQQSIESAALAGSAAQRRNSPEEQGRQALVTRAMTAIEQRGGVASPTEARVVQEANLGKPYDRIDESLEPPLREPEALTKATGIAVGQEPRTSGVPPAIAAERTTAEARGEKVAANAARERANLEGMQRQEARAANATQAREAMRGTMAAATQPRAPERPAVADIEKALSKPPFQRSVEERETLRRARAAYPAADMEAIETPSALRSPEQRLAIKRVGEEGVQRSPARDNELAEKTGLDIRPVDTKTLPRKPQAKGERRTVTRAEADFVQKLGRLFGKKVVFFEGAEDTDGFVERSDADTIYINATAQKPHLVVFGHELTHQLRKDSPETYEALEAAIKSQLGDKAATEFAKSYGADANTEEIVSDLVGNRFSDAEFWAAVFGEMTTQLGEEGGRKAVARVGAAVIKAVNAAKKMLVGQSGFKTDELVKDLDAVKAAVQTAIRRYAADRKIPALKMAAETVEATKTRAAEPTPSPARQAEQPREDNGQFAAFDELEEIEQQVDRQDVRRSPTRNDDGVPNYGGPGVAGSISVRGIHYSKQPRTILNSSTAGTGLKGADNERIERDRGIKDRIYFYVEKGRGVLPEAGVGGYAHEVDLNNLYDADADPDLLAEDNPDPTRFEQAVVDAGFDGYYRDSFRNDVGAAVLLGAHDVPVKQTSQGPSKPTGRTPPRAKAPERTGWRKIAADLKAARSLPAGELSPERWSRVLAATMPDVQQALDEAGVLEGTTPVYKDGLLRAYREAQVQRSPRRQDYVESLLLPDERIKLRRDSARNLVSLFNELPSGSEMAAVAFAGKAKRGWYDKSAKAMTNVFGADAPRFAALLAALSPQTSVENNLVNALRTWKNWTQAGRPTDREEIVRIMGRSVQGNRGVGSVLNAWIPNSIRALTTEDVESVILSGPKVNSFMHNLRGKVDEVTNDAWMANYALIDQTLFAGRLTKTDSGKGTGYLAMSARVREAAQVLTKLTGDTWSPAEVQETVWSWAKTLYEKQASADEDRGARMLVMDKAITDEMIAATPDFRTLFNEDGNAKTLRDAGLTPPTNDGGAGKRQPRAAGQTAPFAEDSQQRYELQAARRLERLYDEGASAFAKRDELILRSPVRSLDEFNDDLASSLTRPGWAIVTATQESKDPEFNARANEQLEAELKERGLDYQTIVGRYKGVDQGPSYLILAEADDALQLGRKYEQESILTSKGLEYSDGDLVPAVHADDKLGAAARAEDFYSELPSGEAFSVGLDFDAKGPVAQKQQSTTIELDGVEISVADPQAAIRQLDSKIDKFKNLISCLSK